MATLIYMAAIITTITHSGFINNMSRLFKTV